MVKDIKTNEFDSLVINSSKPVLVDFWASWCGPCKMLSPAVDAVSEQMSGQADFYKVNVDEEPMLAQQFGIMSIPTLILFKGGEVANQSVGVISEADIKAFVEQAL
ncbi:MAG: thioredoxin [Ruminococcus sp.]|jgi:thioredoxin 1|nr:thioredoxin [Ruminococcus sp.]